MWMMSDERMSAAFLPALRAMPKGSGLVFRHYSLPAADRYALFRQVRGITRARRIVLIIAGATLARADGVHGNIRSGPSRHGLRTMAVHNPRELVQAARAQCDAVFISPVYPTQSHPGVKTLGRRGFVSLARRAQTHGIRPIALGGMTHAQSKTLPSAYGWAAIDAWIKPVS